MKLTLRLRQREALTAAKTRYDQGLRRILIQLPTGVGKTPTFAALRDFFGFKKRILVLVHKEELAAQAAKQLKKWNPDETVGVEMAKSCSLPTDTFVVASVPTISQDDPTRLLKFNPDDFDAVICDEAHHSIAESWLVVLDYFGFFDEKPSDRLLLGVTATTNRGDKRGLGEVYEEVVYQYGIYEAVQEGWLAEPRGYRVLTHTSLANVRSRGGEFVHHELYNVIDNPVRNALLVGSYIDMAYGRRAVVFTEDIQHAKNLAEEFNRQGIRAAAIWGTDKDRAAKQLAHQCGDIEVLCNCDVLTEGYDDWQISCVINGSPTGSQLKFIQRIGRGLRIEDTISNLIEARKAGIKLNKVDCIVIDLVDSTKDHSLVSLPSIFGMPPNLDLKGGSILPAYETVEEYASKHPDIDFTSLTDLDDIAAFAEQINLFTFRLPASIMKASTYQWYKSPSGSYMLRLPGFIEYLEVLKDVTGHWTSKGTVKDNHFVRGGFESPEDGITFADGMLVMLGQGLLTDLKRTSKAHRALASEAQWVMIRNLAREDDLERIPKNLTNGDAKLLIVKMMHKNVERTRKRLQDSNK